MIHKRDDIIKGQIIDKIKRREEKDKEGYYA